jgi:c-di-GMP-binding flagellar brake protein YcgR
VDTSGLDFIWRVRVLDLTETEIIVEQPVAMGEPIELHPHVALIGVMTVGKNRWLFRTENLGSTTNTGGASRSIPALRLRMPASVERCQRRSFYRFGTVGLELPTIRVWPLLDPKSVILAERTNEVRVHAEQSGSLPRHDGQAPNQAPNPGRRNPLTLSLDDVMPEVGPMFRATVMNIGGGGIGALVEPGDAQSLNRHKLFWMQIDLPPQLQTPLCVTGKLVHTHIESSQQVYAGLAFDFSVNPSHQRFITEQIARYIAVQQREQFEQDGGIRH